MKSLIVATISTLAIAVSAVAGNKVVYHDYDAVLGVGAEGIALKNACVTENTVQSIAPVEVCTKLVGIEHPDQGEVGPYTEWVCQEKALKKIVRSRAFEREYCAKYIGGNEASLECVEFAKEAAFLPNTIKINVVTLTSGDAGSDFPGVSSTFTFPACDL